MDGEGNEYLSVTVSGDQRGAGGRGGQVGSIFARRHLQGGELASGSAGPVVRAPATTEVIEAHGAIERPGPCCDASRSREASKSRSRPRCEETPQSELTDVQDVDHNSTAEEGEVTGNPDYMVRWNGEDWIRLNFDSGAVSTVIPVEMAHEQGWNFRVADGDRIPRYGRVRVPCTDEQGGRRGFRATITHVHKPLGKKNNNKIKKHGKRNKKKKDKQMKKGIKKKDEQKVN